MAAKVTLHIVYGIPCVGKSTTAVHLAYHRNLRTVVNTDYLREVQRVFVSPEQAPALAKVTHTAWQLHGPPTLPNIEAGFIDHVNEVATAITAVVRKLVTDGFEAVIEGAHFHGALIDELRAMNDNADIQATLLVVANAEELRQRICGKEANRGQGAVRKSWREHVPILLVLQGFLIADARRHGIQVTTANDWRSSWALAETPYATLTTS